MTYISYSTKKKIQDKHTDDENHFLHFIKLN